MKPDIAWLAGLLEGEASFVATCHSGRYVYLQVSLRMADEDVVRRAAAVFGVGHVTGPYRWKGFKDHWKDQWQWSVTKSADAYAVMIAVWPWLGERRRQQVKSAVGAWRLSVLPTLEERFWSHVVADGACLVWSGHVDLRHGFGAWQIPGTKRKVLVHRYAFELSGLAVPSRLGEPSCGRKTCVVPAHWYLEAVDES